MAGWLSPPYLIVFLIPSLVLPRPPSSSSLLPPSPSLPHFPHPPFPSSSSPSPRGPLLSSPPLANPPHPRPPLSPPSLFAGVPNLGLPQCRKGQQGTSSPRFLDTAAGPRSACAWATRCSRSTGGRTARAPPGGGGTGRAGSGWWGVRFRSAACTTIGLGASRGLLGPPELCRG